MKSEDVIGYIKNLEEENEKLKLDITSLEKDLKMTGENCTKVLKKILTNVKEGLGLPNTKKED